MALYLKLIILVVILVAIVMGVFGLKLLYDRGARFNVESDPDKYKKIKKDGIYKAYSEQNKEDQDKEEDT
ncbi:MAG: hypothetical protein K9H65_01145 [Bacteroidales bacterium]|nr:hypothetical protein [Bacteroidales bacterium]